MGAQCEICLPEGSANQNGVPLIGFPDSIQEMINEIRTKNQGKIREGKDHDLGKGVMFRGTIVEDKKEGYGEFYNQHNAFFGNFEDDLPEGQGILIRSFNQYIKGNFVKGKLDGNGKEKSLDMQFFGKYQMGERASGILKTKLYTYEGDFFQNKFHGFGTLEFKNGDIYQGYMKNGVFHGDGKYETKNGVYNGQFKSGKYEGRGIYRWNDGSYYDGQYRQGQRNGFGKLVKEEFTYEGFWVNGKPQSKHKLGEQGSQMSRISKKTMKEEESKVKVKETIKVEEETISNKKKEEKKEQIK